MRLIDNFDIIKYQNFMRVNNNDILCQCHEYVYDDLCDYCTYYNKCFKLFFV